MGIDLDVDMDIDSDMASNYGCACSPTYNLPN